MHGEDVEENPFVVAHSPDLDTVVAEVRASGLPLADIVLDLIAASPR